MDSVQVPNTSQRLQDDVHSAFIVCMNVHVLYVYIHAKCTPSRTVKHGFRSMNMSSCTQNKFLPVTQIQDHQPQG